jgi:hypothetical protein
MGRVSRLIIGPWLCATVRFPAFMRTTLQWP